MAKVEGRIPFGINAVGRIGRLAVRAQGSVFGLDLVGINAPGKSPEEVVYAIKYDSVHGGYPGSVVADSQERAIWLDGKKIPIFDTRDPAQIPWASVGNPYVIDTTGKLLSAEKAQGHIDAGARAVIFSAPPKDGTDMFVKGVNLDTYKKGTLFSSNASCTTTCLTPAIKLLDDNFGVESAAGFTVHALTGTGQTVDGLKGRDPRSGRASVGNIIPSSTGAAKAVTKILPQLEGKIGVSAVRVDTLDVSYLELCLNLKRSTTLDEIIHVIKEASDGLLKGVAGWTDEGVVSSDLIGDPRSFIFDVMASQAITDKFFQLFFWYDNEWGYVRRLLELLCHAYQVDNA